MDFSSLKDQLTDQLKELRDRIQESSAYVELKEKFELLPSRVQKLVIGGVSVLVALFLFSFPYGNLSDSWLYEEQFLENRELIRDLLRASTTLKERSPLPTMGSAAQVESQVRQVLEEQRLGPEQIGSIQVAPGARTALASNAVNQEAVVVPLKSLNLRQLTEIAVRFQNLGSGVQPITMQVDRAAGQTHYYDVIFRVFQFSLNVDSDEGGASGGAAGGTRRPAPRGGRGR